VLVNIWSVTKKEIRDYFSSSAALLFLGIFLTAVYVTFFWVEAFFARNLADVRPFFDWIPILFIFLISALTMHSWSEERRMGTVELILTSAVSPFAYLIGKFLAVLALITVALALTLPLPMTASTLGELDWGPVVGGYIAALFLAAAYSAIGLWASAQTENQIVSLILSILIAGVLYLLGSTAVTNLFSYEIAEGLRAFATGTRFESITRGVLDLRDIFYYVTIVIVFLLLTRKTLESLRWLNNFVQKKNHQWNRLSILIVISLLYINLAINFITQARIDLTEGKIYSLSKATKEYLKEIDQPLLIRGYLSNSTHPLLAPLVPRMRDLLDEYSIQGKGEIRVEIVDPLLEPELEKEAARKYRIRPVSFHSENRHQASVINTYFNIMVAYKDQFQVLNYKELVELKASAGKHEVDLNNPEYQITRAIRSVVSKADREVDSFENSEDPVVLTAYVSSPALLPNENRETVKVLEQLGKTLTSTSNENFDLFFVNPDNDQLTQQYLENEFDVKPSENDTQQPYWFYFTITDGKKTAPVSFEDQPDEIAIKQSIFSAYKQLLPDSVKTVALMRPLPAPGPAGVIESPIIPKRYTTLRDVIRQSVKVIDVDLRDGKVPGQVDFLMVLAPRFLQPVQISAIQSYLQQGGTVLIATSPIDVNLNFISEVHSVSSGLEQWLLKLGVSIENTLVLDKQHGQYSLPVMRASGNMRMRGTNVINYPYIIDVRGEGLNQQSVITEKLGQIFVPWSSPIKVDSQLNKNRNVIPLLTSSIDNWLSDSSMVLPDFERYPDIGFEVINEQATSQVLATMIEGSFDEKEDDNETSRLIIVGSSSLFTDIFADKMTQVLRSEYKRPAQFMQNIIDWSLEDQGLLNVLRKHSQFTRTLETLSDEEKTYWEYLNYVLGIVGLLLVGLVRVILYKRSRLRAEKILQSV